MDVKIQNLEDINISGVTYCLKKENSPYVETYFNWLPYSMVSDMKTSIVTCGYLTSWHHIYEFDQVEIHAGRELFYFTDGECIMMFCDLDDGHPVMDSIQMAKIKPGTQLCIEAGKAHFVPIPTGDILHAVVFTPEQEAPRYFLTEKVKAVL